MEDMEIKGKKKKQGKLSRRIMLSSVMHAGILGTIIMLISLGLFMYGVLWEKYADTVNLAETASEVLSVAADVPGLVGAVLQQEREDPEFEAILTKDNAAHQEGQLLNYRWYTEEDPPLALREDYQRVMELILVFNQNNPDLNGSSLMVFDKRTHIACLLCDVEKFGGTEAVPVKEILWRTFEDVELDQIEEERWSLLKNLSKYMKIDPNYFVFAWYEPYPYPDDEVVVFIEADAFYTHIWSNVFSFLAVFFLLLLAVVFLMGFLYRRRMNRVIVRPINAVSDAAKSYVEDRRNGHPLKEYFASLELRTGDELEELADTMAEMEREIGIYEEDLTRITAEKERMGVELSVASKIQQDMLPQTFPPYPDRKEFEVYASMDPAKEVGGDFYDIFLIDPDHLALVMADVSGKGIPAALFMVISKTLIQNRAMMGGTPSEILADVNLSLCSNKESSMFVTVWLGIVTLSTGEVAEANAGHENPLLLRRGMEGKNGSYEQLKQPHDFVLGGLKKSKYREDSFRLQPGDQLFIYTDGVPEATNGEGKRFGMERVKESLNRLREEAPEALLKGIRRDVDDFVGDAEQFDDLTMMSFVYRGEEASIDDLEHLADKRMYEDKDRYYREHGLERRK